MGAGACLGSGPHGILLATWMGMGVMVDDRVGVPRVDVVVLTRTPKLFGACAPAVPAWANRIVVDNAGRPMIRHTADRYGWRYLRPGHNTSFSEGCNLGVAVGSAPRILLLNDDAVLAPGALEAMAAHREPIVGALIVQSDGRVNHAGVTFQDGGPTHLGRQAIDPERFRRAGCGQVPAVTFACALVDRAVFEALGGLDEGYWYCFEDVDFCLAAAERGWRCWQCNEATVRHDEYGTRSPGTARSNGARFHGRWTTTGRAAAALERVGYPGRVLAGLGLS